MTQAQVRMLMAGENPNLQDILEDPEVLQPREAQPRERGLLQMQQSSEVGKEGEEGQSGPSKKRKLETAPAMKKPRKSMPKVNPMRKAKPRKLVMKPQVNEEKIIPVELSLTPLAPDIIELLLFFDLFFDLCITPALIASAAAANAPQANPLCEQSSSCLPTVSPPASSSLVNQMRIACFKSQILTRFFRTAFANQSANTLESLLSSFINSAASQGLIFS